MNNKGADQTAHGGWFIVDGSHDLAHIIRCNNCCLILTFIACVLYTDTGYLLSDVAVVATNLRSKRTLCVLTARLSC